MLALLVIEAEPGAEPVEALEEALSLHGRPEIFNTDQGSQFTSDDFTGTLERASSTWW